MITTNQNNMGQTADIDTNNTLSLTLKDKIEATLSSNAALQECFPAVEEYKIAQANLAKAKDAYAERVPDGCLVSDAAKQETAMLTYFFDVQDMGAKAYSDSFYREFLGDMAERFKDNMDKLDKRPITRTSRPAGVLNEKQEKFFAIYFRETTKRLIELSDDNQVNAKTIKETVMNIFTAEGKDGSNPALWQDKLYPTYNGEKTLKELLERDSDFSSTLKAICEKGEFDYKVTKYNGDKNQHMIAPFGFYDGQEDSSSDLLQKGEFVPMPTAEEQEMAPPLDVNNDGEAW